MYPGRGQPSRSDLFVRFFVIRKSYAVFHARQIGKSFPHVNQPIDQSSGGPAIYAIFRSRSDSGKTEPRIDRREVRNTMARPDNLTSEIAKRIVDAIRVGATVELAAAAAGVGTRTLYRWKERGETNTSGKYWQFWQEVKKAAADEELAGLAEIYQASRRQVMARETKTVTNSDGKTVTSINETFTPGEWQARSWLMERRHRQRWGRQANIDLDASTLGVEAVNAYEEREARLNRLRRLTSEQLSQLRKLNEIMDGKAPSERKVEGTGP
jgi:hypothetical protein